MSTIVQQSSAFVTFVKGDHIQDVQIIIDNRELYNALPGKLERHGIKTLTFWPIFVTAIMNETQSLSNPQVSTLSPSISPLTSRG